MKEVYTVYKLKNTVLSSCLETSGKTTQLFTQPLPAPPSHLRLPAEGDDWGTLRHVPGGKLTLGPGDVGHQEDVGEWQGGYGRGHPKDHSGWPFTVIHPVSGLSDLEVSPRHMESDRNGRQGWKITGARKWHLNLATGLEHLCSRTPGWAMTCRPSFLWVLPRETLGHWQQELGHLPSCAWHD